VTDRQTDRIAMLRRATAVAAAARKKTEIKTPLPIVADFINSKEDAIHVVNESTLLYVLPQHVTDGII